MPDDNPRSKTTYVNRANSHDKVYQMANDKLAEQAPRGATGIHNNIARLSQYYEVAKCKLFQDSY